MYLAILKAFEKGTFIKTFTSNKYIFFYISYDCNPYLAGLQSARSSSNQFFDRPNLQQPKKRHARAARNVSKSQYKNN